MSRERGLEGPTVKDRTVIEILEKAIKEGGYDGLFLANTCACTLKDGLEATHASMVNRHID